MANNIKFCYNLKIKFKSGYRDAQIGWICVDDESEEKSNKRYAIYLIIYAPRRGLVEVKKFIFKLKK